MRYYESDDPNDKIKQVQKRIRRAITREYGNNKTGNIRYRENRKAITKTTAEQLRLKLDLPGRVFHPAQHEYQLAQLARRNEKLVAENTRMIDENPRVQLSTEIPKLQEVEPKVAVFAIEQLLQEPGNLSSNAYSGLGDHLNGGFRIDIGLDKLAKVDAEKSSEIRQDVTGATNSRNLSFEKRRYTIEILDKVIKEFREETKSQEALRKFDQKIVGEIIKSDEELRKLKNDVAMLLETHGITTGFDTGFETFIKSVIGKVKSVLGTLSQRKNSELTSGKEAVNGNDQSAQQTNAYVKKEQFFARINGRDFDSRHIAPKGSIPSFDDAPSKDDAASNDGMEPGE